MDKSSSGGLYFPAQTFPPEVRMGVTIKDVADRAGVAASTVSRVIHDNPRISEETRIRVRLAMEELGYHPNAAARSLAKGKTQTLGLIIPNSENDLFIKPFFITAMRGLSIEAQRRGYNIMFSFASSEEEEVCSLQRFVRQNAVDGVILMTSRDEDKSMAFLESKGFPYVVIGRPEARFSRALWVDNDNHKAMHAMVRYFQERGKKHIAFLGGPMGYRVTQNRLRGYRDALTEAGQEGELVELCGGFLEEDGYEGAKRLLERARPDAIAAADDFLAIGAMNYMDRAGLSLPLSGFNNTMKGGIIRPALTTVDIRSALLGTRAADLLITRLERPESSAAYSVVDTLLIERESSRA